ncbi:hypothetical protein HUB98_26580 [Paenibacillus barcinonensis]|uniref:Uncharacterized protein n=1 Tax=Paenibacillus barcinonensis TaxID=198119 RepID=A0A2V4WV29_PAEBA|nr:hypothetical protein [Paenibacillus barcinonensis]PYE52477.1 hypothetical protein DFQ00_101415 [Paenibacillus barcinonensis]QKS59360.1 hypothetical protein HUB98_26250 [Paenibacillus barcinonensis]QKS59418.1 hypothetical protein HUB98_26580 [Paenibacillus barcinonensis]
MKKVVLLLSSLLLATTLTACGTESADQNSTEVSAEEKAEQPAVNWESSIKDLAATDQSETEKADAAEVLARAYKPSSEELKNFQTHIIEAFTSGEYLKDSTNAEYMLSNIFQSVVVERQADEAQAMKKYAQDFYQNTKYVYRGAETPDSESVKSNEEQMTNAINGK